MIREYRVNDQIEAEQVSLVLPDGSMKGEVLFSEALLLAEEKNLDLVEISISKGGKPPVCKILDYGKMMYHHKKKQKSNNHAPRNKEIRYSFNISEHDLEVKHNKVKEFISKQHIVRYVLELKGREKNLVEDAKRKIEDNLKDFEGMAQWPVPVVSHGRKIEISTTIRSK